jgi:hypothetical protein
MGWPEPATPLPAMPVEPDAALPAALPALPPFALLPPLLLGAPAPPPDDSAGEELQAATQKPRQRASLKLDAAGTKSWCPAREKLLTPSTARVTKNLLRAACRPLSYNAHIHLRDLLELQRRCHGKNRLAESVGDGFLYLKNPYFRRIRDAALAAGFRFKLGDVGAYYGFPLIHLDTLLTHRRIPYRPSFTALEHLEASRPGFFTLGDLQKNRPSPNYLLHESAHAVAFHVLFGRPKDVAQALSEPSALVKLMLGESFAMTSEYFAACAVQGQPHGWFFSISSYRHRTQKKKAVGELVTSYGFEFVARAVLLAFLCNNFLVDRLDRKQLAALVAAADENIARRLSQVALRKLGSALNGLMVMSPEFRYDTSRLFLTMFGRSRDIRRELSADPLQLLADDPRAQRAAWGLVARLAGSSRRIG